MSESAFLSNLPRTAASSSDSVHCAVEQVSAPLGARRRKPQRQQPRQLLSCTKCRERKVKCDRIKPCSACCARGQPKECHFVAEEGDYPPIQQSYELKRLQAENLRLKERLRASRIPIEDDEADCSASPNSQHGEGPVNRSHRRRTTKQHRFQGSEWSDSLYFGSPGLANVINEFASMNVSPTTPYSLAHLTHAMPRGADMYAPRDLPLYPFATLFPVSLEEAIPKLLECLPPTDELFRYLDSFQKRVHVCFFPHIPTEITKSEVERFLSDPRKNSEKCPDMLGLLFAALALGSQVSVWDKCGGKWVAGAMEEQSKTGNVYIAAAMQALRMASFMNRPTLVGIQALIMMGPYLTNSGRFLDAWTLFGTTIRLAHSIGLHRHPKYLDPAPPTDRECHMRQTLWWWMLHMDQQYSMTLGRPLGISGIGDCPPPYELTTDQTFLRFGEFVHQFTVLSRHILSSDRLTTAKIDDFTDQLRKLLDTMPEMLQFDESWLDERTEIPEWPLSAMAAVFYCKTHNYLILLNRRRLDKKTTRSYSQDTTGMLMRSSPPAFHSVNQAPSTHSSPTSSAKATLRGRPLVLSSSEDLLTAFLFFYHRVPAALICWTTGQQAFNSCMILILDALETGDLSRIRKVEKAYAVFTELDNNGVHKLANLAVERVSWGLNELKRMQDEARKRDSGNATLTRGVRHGNSMEMRDAGRSEATRYSGAMQDTVMGNTGMLLLEDPGLQSFVREDFSPFTWVMAGDELDKQKEGEQQKWCDGPAGAKNEANRSSGHAQGVQGSAPGSAQLRYATFSAVAGTGAQGQYQPQGLTSPISPTSSTTPTHTQQNEALLSDLSTGLHQVPPPHLRLRHHSYPSVQQQVHTPSLALHPPYTSGYADRAHGMPNPNPNLNPNNVLGYFAHSQPTMQMHSLSEMSSPGLQGVHPSWAARPAVPAASGPDAVMSFAHVSDSGVHRAAPQDGNNTGYENVGHVVPGGILRHYGTGS